MNSLTKALTIASLAASVTLVGCHKPGGGWFARTGDTDTYFSYEDRPTTITLIDTSTREELFSMDIPPGKQLVLDFVPGDGDDPVYRPDLMRYQIMDRGEQVGSLRNSLTVPAYDRRMVVMDIREGWENRPEPPDADMRADKAADRPEWWTAKGGPMPADKGRTLYDERD